MTARNLPRLALTMGDPAGIGPELLAKAVADRRWHDRAELILYGDREVLETALARFAPGCTAEICACTAMTETWRLGEAQAACGRAAFETVTRATLDALAGRVEAIVTAPMNKYAVNLAGIPFTGHTELIAELCHVPEVVMMQSAGNLRVVFVTTHIGIAEVASQVTRERIDFVTRRLFDVCRAEGIAVPKLAAAALNPHAGEDGFMGREDEDTVKPALAALRRDGIDIAGPFPPDTLFIPGTLEKFDGIVSMYHDQGHIPFKMLAFDRGVNSTLGLPIIRTSPDHGTAFAIAGQGVADTGSFFAAIDAAIRRCR